MRPCFTVRIEALGLLSGMFECWFTTVLPYVEDLKFSRLLFPLTTNKIAKAILWTDGMHMKRRRCRDLIGAPQP